MSKRDSAPLSAIAFDADDTLWHNERFFQLTQARFAELLADHVEAPDLMSALLDAERRNIARYGFGIKGFVLSMIETALDVSNQTVPASVIAELVAAGKDMLAHPIELLPHAREAVLAAKSFGPVLLITKGDLLDQERKLAQSGLGELFDRVEIVSQKTPSVYGRIFASYPGGAQAGMMIGNSMKSDVLPMIEAGGNGVFVPHDLGWDLEHAQAPSARDNYHEIADLGALPTLIYDILKG